AGDARVELGRIEPAGMQGFVIGIEPSQEFSFHVLYLYWPSDIRAQIQNRRAGGAKPRSLKQWREEARLPILHAINWQAQGIVENDIGREVLIFRSESINDPRTNRRPARTHFAAVDQIKGRLMRQVRREHRPNECDIIDHAGEVWHHFRNPGAAFAMLSK